MFSKALRRNLEQLKSDIASIEAELVQYEKEETLQDKPTKDGPKQPVKNKTVATAKPVKTLYVPNKDKQKLNALNVKKGIAEKEKSNAISKKTEDIAKAPTPKGKPCPCKNEPKKAQTVPRKDGCFNPKMCPVMNFEHALCDDDDDEEYEEHVHHRICIPYEMIERLGATLAGREPSRKKSKDRDKDLEKKKKKENADETWRDILTRKTNSSRSRPDSGRKSARSRLNEPEKAIHRPEQPLEQYGILIPKQLEKPEQSIAQIPIAEQPRKPIKSSYTSLPQAQKENVEQPKRQTNSNQVNTGHDGHRVNGLRRSLTLGSAPSVHVGRSEYLVQPISSQAFNESKRHTRITEPSQQERLDEENLHIKSSGCMDYAVYKELVCPIEEGPEYSAQSMHPQKRGEQDLPTRSISSTQQNKSRNRPSYNRERSEPELRNGFLRNVEDANSDNDDQYTSHQERVQQVRASRPSSSSQQRQSKTRFSCNKRCSEREQPNGLLRNSEDVGSDYDELYSLFREHRSSNGRGGERSQPVVRNGFVRNMEDLVYDYDDQYTRPHERVQQELPNGRFSMTQKRESRTQVSTERRRSEPEVRGVLLSNVEEATSECDEPPIPPRELERANKLGSFAQNNQLDSNNLLNVAERKQVEQPKKRSSAIQTDDVHRPSQIREPQKRISSTQTERSTFLMAPETLLSKPRRSTASTQVDEDEYQQILKATEFKKPDEPVPSIIVEESDYFEPPDVLKSKESKQPDPNADQQSKLMLLALEEKTKVIDALKSKLEKHEKLLEVLKGETHRLLHDLELAQEEEEKAKLQVQIKTLEEEKLKVLLAGKDILLEQIVRSTEALDDRIQRQRHFDQNIAAALEVENALLSVKAKFPDLTIPITPTRKCKEFPHSSTPATSAPSVTGNEEDSWQNISCIQSR